MSLSDDVIYDVAKSLKMLAEAIKTLGEGIQSLGVRVSELERWRKISTQDEDALERRIAHLEHSVLPRK